MNTKKTLKRIFAGILLNMFCLMTFAQQHSIKGIVSDKAGEPIIGVAVVEKGTGNGTTTDIDGKYQLSVSSPESTLIFSYLGYLSQEIVVGTKRDIQVTLQENTTELDEVVIIGYGVVKKRDLTGSVSSVKAADIEKVSASNAMQAMQARVPGLDIQQNSGQAGASLNMTLRGNRSINASNAPLVLVDGVEYGSTIDLSASDIESMEVLKDASSTAIYGTRGANGVIIITTKT